VQRTLALCWLPRTSQQGFYPEFGLHVYGEEQGGQVIVRVQVFLGRDKGRIYTPAITGRARNWAEAARDFGQIQVAGETIYFGPGGMSMSRKSFETMD
jgi:hypothetical protein